MKAIVYTKYGPPEVLQLKEIEKRFPKGNEVLIRVLATSVTRLHCWARSCKARTGLGFLMRMWFGVRKPKRTILGTELSGDQVFAYLGINLGAYAEYVCLPKKRSQQNFPKRLLRKPPSFFRDH